MSAPVPVARPAELPTPLRIALEIEIPSDVRFIERVVQLITRHCADLHFNARQCALNVPVALTEALSNAILRGNRESPGTIVTVRAEMTPERLVVDIVDEGAGFELSSCLTDPTRPENLTREDGRGLFLMTRLMDRIERFSNGGNVVRMVLRRND